MVINKHVMPALLIISAAIGMVAACLAYNYRFINAQRADLFVSVENLAIGVIFLLVAKINLVREPQHQSLAIFAAVFAGFEFSYALEKFFSLL